MDDKDNQNQSARKTSNTDKATAVFLSYVLATGVPYTTSRTPEFMGERLRKGIPKSTALPHANEEQPSFIKKIEKEKAIKSEIGL